MVAAPPRKEAERIISAPRRGRPVRPRNRPRSPAGRLGVATLIENGPVYTTIRSLKRSGGPPYHRTARASCKSLRIGAAQTDRRLGDARRGRVRGHLRPGAGIPQHVLRSSRGLQCSCLQGSLLIAQHLDRGVRRVEGCTLPRSRCTVTRRRGRDRKGSELLGSSEPWGRACGRRVPK